MVKLSFVQLKVWLYMFNKISATVVLSNENFIACIITVKKQNYFFFLKVETTESDEFILSLRYL